MLLKAFFFLRQRINSPPPAPCFFHILSFNISAVVGYLLSEFPSLLPLLLLTPEETHNVTRRLSSLSLGLAAASALTRHRHVIFQLLAWHLGLCRFGLGLCLALKLNRCNRAQLKPWQAGSPCTMLPPLMNKTQLWTGRLLSGSWHLLYLCMAGGQA